MTTHTRKIKIVKFSVGATAFECQVKNWKMNNNTPVGEKLYAQCPDGEFFEEPEPDFSFDVVFYADWRLNGVSDWLQMNKKTTQPFELQHHYDQPGEGVKWTGFCWIPAPGVGGEERTTELTEVTFPCTGEPDYARL